MELERNTTPLPIFIVSPITYIQIVISIMSIIGISQKKFFHLK